MKRLFARQSFWFLLLFDATHLYSQAPQLVQLTPPSPNVMAFQKYGDIPASAYTGIPDISIPIYTIKFRDISIPISISYHASGIKVSEEASQVGLGWVLNAAGTISRNIIGADDFSGYVYFNGVSDTLMDFSDGQGPTRLVQGGCNLQMFNSSIPNQPTIYQYDITHALQASPVYDFQPDQYYYNYPGHSGKFIMKRNMQTVLQKQESIQISCLATDGSVWQIKSAEGYIYDFTKYETYTESAATHKSAWYLTKITSPTGNIATFNYTQTSTYVQSVGSYSETRDDWDICVGPTQGPITNTGYQYGPVPGKQYVSWILSNIDFTNGKVVFNYSNTRTDLPNDPKLDSVSIFNQAAVTPFKVVAFVYDYFNGTADPSFSTGSPGSATQRLKLTQLIEKGYYNGQSIQNPPYQFTYNENNNLPAKTSFARDHWGYYNGVTGRGSLIPSVIVLNSGNPYVAALGLSGLERETNPYWAPGFTLNKLQYPTGGWTEFQYESNDFDETQSEINDHSYYTQQGASNTPVQKSETVGYDAVARNYLGSNVLDLTNEYVPPGGGPSPAVTINANFRFSGGPGGNCNTITTGGSNQMYFMLKDAGGNTISQVDPFVLPVCNAGQTNSPCVVCQGGPVFTYSNSYQLAPGVYTWQAFVGTNGAALLLQDIHATYSWYEMSSSGTTQTNTITIGGGLRIKRIIDHDGINESNNKIRRYDYHYWADKIGSGSVAEYSWGRRMSKPLYTSFAIAVDDYGVTLAFQCTVTRYHSAHLIRSSDSNNPLNGSASGAVVGYDQVTELIGENGEFGKKVYKYYNNPDYVNNYGDMISLMGLPMRPPYNSNLVDPLNGSLISEKDYAFLKGSYYKVKEITNRDTTITSKENVVYGVVYLQPSYYTHGDPCWGVPPGTCDNDGIIESYKTMLSEWTFVSGTNEKIYNQNGDTLHYTESQANYFYDNPNHLQLTRIYTANSKGEQVLSTIRYPLDFTIPGGANDAFTQGIQNLEAKHIVSAPVEKYVQKQKADGTNIGATSYVLTSYNSTLPTPSLAYVSMLSAPNTGFAASTITTGGLVKDAAYQPLISFDNYDAYGNLIQQHKVNDINHAYIWDYNNSLLIAEVTNAATNEIAYTSFEADGTGNWTFTDPARNTSFKMTGSQSYTITTGKTISKSGLTSGKTYVVSYWSRNGAISVNGVAATTGVTRSGWTYYEHLLPNTTTTVTITGNNVTLDELRLYPGNALMSTYTYMQVIGLTSTCSPTNMIQSYVYDAMGRLKQIIDQDGNIVKTVEYHYQGQFGF